MGKNSNSNRQTCYLIDFDRQVNCIHIQQVKAIINQGVCKLRMILSILLSGNQNRIQSHVTEFKSLNYPSILLHRSACCADYDVLLSVGVSACKGIQKALTVLLLTWPRTWPVGSEAQLFWISSSQHKPRRNTRHDQVYWTPSFLFSSWTWRKIQQHTFEACLRTSTSTCNTVTGLLLHAL